MYNYRETGSTNRYTNIFKILNLVSCATVSSVALFLVDWKTPSSHTEYRNHLWYNVMQFEMHFNFRFLWFLFSCHQTNPAHRHTTLDFNINYSNYFIPEKVFDAWIHFTFHILASRTHSFVCPKTKTIQLQKENELWFFSEKKQFCNCEWWIAGNCKAANYFAFFSSSFWISLLKSYFSFVS